MRADHAIARVTTPSVLVGCLALLMTGACAANVHPFSIDDAAYKRVWAADWSAVQRDAAPYRATSTSPGVCNVGGSQRGCVLSDQRVVDDLNRLIQDLQTTRVPSEYAKANSAVLDACKVEVQGLQLRDRGLGQQDTQSFSQSDSLLRAASHSMTLAYALFPPYDRPIPAPPL